MRGLSHLPAAPNVTTSPESTVRSTLEAVPCRALTWHTLVTARGSSLTSDRCRTTRDEVRCDTVGSSMSASDVPRNPLLNCPMSFPKRPLQILRQEIRDTIVQIPDEIMRPQTYTKCRTNHVHTLKQPIPSQHLRRYHEDDEPTTTRQRPRRQTPRH